MNEQNNSQTGLSDTFTSSAGSTSATSNPFTADLKGEFTSNFGTSTNAVSQIFKEGGFTGGGDKKKIYIAAAVVVVLLGVVAAMMIGGGEETDTDDPVADGSEDPAGEGSGSTVADASGSGSVEGAASDEASGSEDVVEGSGSEEAVGSDVAEQAPKSGGVPHSMPHSGGGGGFGGKITLTEPADGASLNYDETQGPAVFNWSGGGGYIVFSRSQSMSPPAMKVAVSGNSYSFLQPWPGTWYWKVENKSGSTEVRSFKVSGPSRRNIALSAPASGGTLAASGGVVTWQGDNKIAFYRVELSAGGWANPTYRFASSGNSLALSGVTPGPYQMRLGAFSEVAGRWEYTAAIPVTVQ